MKTFLLVYGYENYDYDIQTVEGHWELYFRDRQAPIAIIEITEEMLQKLNEKLTQKS